MGLIVKDRVMEASTTTGTGALTLAGAYTGFRSFSSVCSINDTVWYLIEAIDGSGNPTGEWEAGYGTYSGASTLTRTLVTGSSNADNAVNFGAGTKRVSVSLVADQAKYRGARVKKSGNQVGANYSALTTMTFDAEDHDTSSFHDNVTNNSRISIPVGVNKVRFDAQVEFTLMTADNWAFACLLKNGSATGMPKTTYHCSTTSGALQLSSPVLDVDDGADYFELQFQVETDTSIDIQAGTTWFAVHVIA